MCIFCAAVPVAASIGAAANSKQRQNEKLAEARGETPPRKIVPAGKATAFVVGGLVICSVVYHTQLHVPI